MHVYAQLSDLPAAPRAVAIGTFDGVHVGHQRVISSAVAEAIERHLLSSVLTFAGHPAGVFDPSRAPRLLTPLSCKERLIAELGPDELVVVPFDRAFAALSADVFCRQVLVEQLNARVVVVGENFTYGAGGSAGANDLRSAGQALGFATIVVPLVTERGTAISSTRIRTLLQRGRLEEVREILGRPPSAAGLVAVGFKRGRTLGVPTANLEVEAGTIFPGRGVYAGRAQVRDRWYRAAVNVGHNPTFQSRDEETVHLTIEAHLLGFSGDIYDQRIRIDFLHKIRDERRFAGVAELMAQMQADIAATAVLHDPAYQAVGL